MRLLGVHNTYLLAANQAVNTQTVLQSIADFTIPLAASQKCKVRGYVPFALAGTASGAKFELLPPNAPTAYLFAFQIFNGNGSGTLATAGVQTAAASFSNALANATNHLLLFDAFVQASTAGSLILQYAQLVSDAANITILAGGMLDVWVF